MQSAYDLLVSLATKSHIVIKEHTEYYKFVLSIDLKDTATVELVVAKQSNTPQSVDDEQQSIKDIKIQLVKQNAKLDSIENKINMINIKIDKQDAVMDILNRTFDLFKE